MQSLLYEVRTGFLNTVKINFRFQVLVWLNKLSLLQLKSSRNTEIKDLFWQKSKLIINCENYNWRGQSISSSAELICGPVN